MGEERKKKVAVITLLLAGVILITACSAKVSSSSYFDNLRGNYEMTLYKTPTCGCCSVYSQYTQREGFSIRVYDLSTLDRIKEQYKIPASLQSCHTTIVGGYFVEGHIPVEAIDKLLAEKPEIAGIAMPGMPSGSPGMPGRKNVPWIIYAVGKEGNISEFVRY